MSVTSEASTTWKGSLTEGSGEIALESSKQGPFVVNWKARSEGSTSVTTPEELIAAAHSSCFSMALSLMLGEKNLTAKKISTKAEVTLEKLDDGFSITAVHLTMSASIPGTDDATFQSIANRAKTGCPVSKLLNAKITLDATLEA